MSDKDAAVNGNFEANKNRFANLYGTFGTNPLLEEQGVIFPYELQDGQVVKFKLRRAGARNSEWKKHYNAVIKPHEDRVEDGSIPEAEMKSLLAVVYAKSVVIGWEGIKDSNGEEVPFTPDAACDLLQFLPDLFTMIINDSHDRANFREAQMEKTEKN